MGWLLAFASINLTVVNPVKKAFSDFSMTDVFVRELCSGYVIVVAGRIVEFQYHRKASLRLDENQYATVVEYVPVDGVHRVIDVFPEVRPQVGSRQIEHNGLVRRFGDRRAGSDPFVLGASREEGRRECKDKHYMM
jgi:hypothetical protein